MMELLPASFYPFRKILFLSVMLAIGGCDAGNANGESDGKDGEEETPPVPVEVRLASRGDVFATYTGTASLESDQDAMVVAKVTGEVKQLLVEEGDRVKAGTVMARLDGDRLRLELKRSEANLRKLRQEYERNVELHEKGLVSAGAFEGMKYELDAMTAANSLARLELSYTEITAPIDGLVSDRYIKVGNTISVNDPVFHITDMDPLLAYLFVPEREFRKLRIGQVAQVGLDAVPGQVFSASIDRISPVVDPQTGTFKVTLAIYDESARLKPGMFGRFQIVYDAHTDVVMIPRVAVIEDDTRQSVFIVDDGVAHRRIVRTGYAREDQIEITEGLTGDETVIIIGQNGLKEDALVDVVRGIEPTS
jgi:membrane fusion protein (multidrug efflux system)